MALKDTVKEAFTDAGIFAVVSLALKKLTIAAGEKIGQGAGDVVQKHLEKLQQKEQRGELFATLQTIHWDEKKNIIGLLKKAVGECNENHVVRLLVGLPKASREAALKYLNKHLPECNVTEEEEGEILLELLDDNGTQQLAEKLWNKGEVVGRKIRDEYLPEVKQATKKLGLAGDSAASTLGGLTKWLEKHGGK